MKRKLPDPGVFILLVIFGMIAAAMICDAIFAVILNH